MPILNKAQRAEWCDSTLSVPFKNVSDCSIETDYMAKEVRQTFIGGHFISTVLVAISFCEHTIADWLYLKGMNPPKAQIKLGTLCKLAKNQDLFDNAFWGQFDKLRKIRNAYAHRCWEDIPIREQESDALSSQVRPAAWTVTARAMPPQKNQLTPEERDKKYPSALEVMEQDAKDALMLMDRVYHFRRHSGIIRDDF